MKNISLVLLLLSTLGVLSKSSTFEKTQQAAKKRMGRFIIPSHITNSELQNLINPYERLTPKDSSTYDFIVIGSGSAGSVVANRLSENPQWRVLLLEEGDEATPITDIPLIIPAFRSSALVWNYLTEKQDNVGLGIVNQQFGWLAGRAIGGTSTIDCMMHTRGNRRDFNRWANLGNPGWSYRDVFRYFTKSEDCRVTRQDPGYHGIGSYLSVEDVAYRTESAKAFVQAAQESGYSYVDYNGKRQSGVSYIQTTTKRGRRWSAEAAFLRNFTSRPNLTILGRSRVVQILINNSTKEAYGVQYIRDRQYFTAMASKEVVLSAGALNSPHLLMLSGIGPRDHLQELNIPILQDLPVGRKLYDHITFFGLVFTVNQSIVTDYRKAFDIPTYLEYISNNTGPLTVPAGVEALLYLKTSVSRDETKNYPDIELIFTSGSLASDDGLFNRHNFRINDDIYNKVFRPLERQYTFSILPMLLHPKSYGFLKLKSTNPYQWPKFYPRYFTDSGNQDLRTLIAAIREVQRIVKAPAFQKYNAQLVTTPIPGCQQYSFNSDQYWECAIRHITPSLYGQVATCKMGPANDPEAVVNSKLQVYGIKNLRVADASIIPIPITGHTSAATLMVGEKAADLLKATWGSLNGRLLRNTDVRFDKNM